MTDTQQVESELFRAIFEAGVSFHLDFRGRVVPFAREEPSVAVQCHLAALTTKIWALMVMPTSNTVH